MARSTGPIYVADNSVTAINDALQQLLFLLDDLKGEHDTTTIRVGPHTHAAVPGDADGGAVSLPADTIDHDDLVNVTTDQHHAKLHETLHREGGTDELKLDDCGQPEDNTDLNSSATAHGLLPKLSNNSNTFLDGTGAWATPSVVAEEAADVANIEGDATSPIWEQIQAYEAPNQVAYEVIANGSALKLFAPLIIRKTQDEAIGNNTFQNDDELFFSIGANEIWEVTLLAVVTCASQTPDWKMTFLGPSGSTFDGLIHGNGTATTTAATVVASAGHQNTDLSAGTIIHAIGTTSSFATTALVWGIIINGSTPGTIQLQWAQNTSDANSVTLQAGSFLKATRLK